jgi:iron(III) transport system substrate-binding protein
MKFYLLIGIAILLAATLWFLNTKGSSHPSVTVYVSEDQIFSEPILKDFEKETGIQVKAIFDTEEAKSTGAMNRLIAEKENPQADVYWANEPIRAEVLKQKGISAPYLSPNSVGIPAGFKDAEGHWTGFSARARVLVVNKNAKDKPDSIHAYTDPRWKGRAVIANPLFGTTTDEISALFVLWGDDATKTFMNQLKANDVQISSDNGESTDFVASGKFDFALVDSDDAINRMKMGKPIEFVYPNQSESDIGVMIVPNAVVLIKGAPHSENGKKLIDYLLSKGTERKLAFSDAAQIPLHQGVEVPPIVKPIETLRVMKVEYPKVAEKMVQIQPFLKEWVSY